MEYKLVDPDRFFYLGGKEKMGHVVITARCRPVVLSGFESHEFFAWHYGENKSWTITEAVTGAHIFSGRGSEPLRSLLKSAAESLTELLEKHRVTFDAVIDDNVRRWGTTPRYAIKED